MGSAGAGTTQADIQIDTTTLASNPTWIVVAAIMDFVLGSMLGSCIAVVIFKVRSSRLHERCLRRPRKREDWFPMVGTSPSLQFAGVEDARSTTVMVPH